MKYLKKLLMILTVSTLLARGAEAFVLPDFTPTIPGPMGQLNLTGIVSELGTMKSYVDQVETHRNTLQSMTDLSKITQLAKQYALKMAKGFMKRLLKKKKKLKVISYSVTIDQCKKARVFDNTENDLVVVKIDNEEHVNKAFEKMFLQYSTRKAMSKYVYEQKGEQLKMDTTLEMFLVAKEMQKEIAGREVELFGAPLIIPEGESSSDVEAEAKKLEKQLIEKAKNIEKDLGLLTQLKLHERCLVAGQFCEYLALTSCNSDKDDGGVKGPEGATNPGGESGEDRMCPWNSAIYAERLYDRIMSYNENIVAMLMQYRSVKAINNIAKIQEYESELTDEELLESELEDNYRDNNIITASRTTTAEASFAARETTEQNAEIELKRWGITRDSTDNTLHGDFEFNEGNENFKDPLEDKEEDILDMRSIAAAQEDLQEAIAVHGALQMLPDYLEVYKSYQHAIDMHKLSRKKVLMSGNCVKRFLEPYYANINKTWYGRKNCTEDPENEGRIICHYDPSGANGSSTGSAGLYDVACPDDNKQKCYAIDIDDYLDSFGEEPIVGEEQTFVTEVPDEDTIKGGGILQYLIELYHAAIDDNAVYAYDKEDVVVAVVDDGQENVYAPQIAVQSEKMSEDNPDKNPLTKHFEPVDRGDDGDSGDTPSGENQQDEDNPDEGGSNVYATERDELTDTDAVTEARNNRDADAGQYEADPQDPDSQPQIKNQDEKDAQDADAREQELLRWTIGASVVKDIADDVGPKRGDPKFGEPGGHNFPKWNDYMEFYNEYLTGKYQNMVDYISSIPTGVLLKKVAAAKGIQLILDDGTGDGTDGDNTGDNDGKTEENNSEENNSEENNSEDEETTDGTDGDNTGDNDGKTEENNSEENNSEENNFEDEETTIRDMIHYIETMFANVEEDYKLDLEKLNKKRELLIRDRDKAAEKLSEVNARYNKANKEINRGNLAADAGEMAREYNDSLYADREGADVKQMPQHRDAERMREEGEKLRAKAEADRELAEKDADGLEEKIKELEEKIEELDAKIEDRKHKYIMDMVSTEEEAKGVEEATVNSLIEARHNDKTLEEYIQKLLTNILPLTEQCSLLPSDFVAPKNRCDNPEDQKLIFDDLACGELFKCAREYAINVIWKYALKGTKGDKSPLIKAIERRDVYDPGYGETLRQTVHEPIIKALKHITIANMATVCTPPEYAGLTTLGITEVDLLGDICKDDFCTTPEADEEGNPVYLLGPKGLGLPHDFVPPSNAPIFSSAPLREIFHFDEDDFTYFSRWYHSVFQNGFCDSDECITSNADIYMSQRLLYNEMIRDPDDPDNDTVFMHSPSMDTVTYGEEAEKDSMVPEIWRWMLKPWIYELSSYNLERQIGNEDNPYQDENCKSENKTSGARHDLGRIGMYPCLYISPEAPADENLYVIDAHETKYAYKGSRPEYKYQLDEYGNKKRGKDGKYIRALDEDNNFLWIEELVHYIDQHKLDPSPYDPDNTPPEDVLKLLPKCTALETHGVENEDVLIYDKEVGYELDDPRNPYNDSKGTVSSQSSELGRIFTFRELYSPGKPRLTYNQYLINSMMNHYDNYGEEGHENETSRENYGRRIFLRTNQLGSFLDQYEGMRVTATDSKKTEKKMLETRKEIEKLVSDLKLNEKDGFVLSPEFDMNNPKDYELLRNELIKVKEAYLTHALAVMSEVKGQTNEMKERRNKILREIALYQMDREGIVEGYPGDLVSISGDETEEEMMTKILEANSNYAINQEIIKEQQKERENELNRIWLPYCAVYPIE